MKSDKKIIKILILNILFYTFTAKAGPSRIGNGDVGADLSQFEQLHVGKLVKAQKKAAELLRVLNVRQLPSLDLLLPEVQKSDLYLVKLELSKEKLAELGQWEKASGHHVYARTMARPHSPTRFFRQALDLEEQQLIALHIHEGLHRALPAQIRENEKIITKVTTLITTPDVTFESLKRELSKVHALFDVSSAPADLASAQRFHPSYMRFGLSSYSKPEESKTNRALPIKRRYEFESTIYPFENNNHLAMLGIGASTSVIELNSDASNFFGAFSIFAKGKIFKLGKFDVTAMVKGTFNTFSKEKIEQSLEGRDYFTVGMYFYKTKKKYYFNHGIELVSKSDVKSADRNYEIGNIGKFLLRAGRKINKHFTFGGIGELFYLDSFKLKGDNLDITAGGSQFMAIGPQFLYQNSDYSIELKGRYLLDTQDGSNFNYINDLFDNGQGQWKWTLNYSLLF